MHTVDNLSLLSIKNLSVACGIIANRIQSTGHPTTIHFHGVDLLIDKDDGYTGPDIVDILIDEIVN